MGLHRRSPQAAKTSATSGNRSRRPRLFWGGIGAAALALIVAILVFPAWTGGGLINHTECQETASAAGTYWTPLLLLDSPFGGTVVGKASVDSPRLGNLTYSSSVSNGSSAAMFTLDDWQLITEHNVSAWGPGSNQPCAVSSQLVDMNRSATSFTPLALKTTVLTPPNSTSNRAEPTRVNLSTTLAPPYGPYSGLQWFDSVFFDSRFAEANSPPIESCLSHAPPPPVGPVSSVVVVVGVRIAGASGGMNLTTAVPDFADYEYFFGGDSSGVWAVDNLSASTGSGVAFDWSACP